MDVTAERLVEFGRNAVDAAIAGGADAAEVFGRYGDAARSTLRRSGEVAHREGTEGSVAVRVWRGGRAGTATTNAPFAEDPRRFARRALDLPHVPAPPADTTLPEPLVTGASARSRPPDRDEVVALMESLFGGAASTDPLGCQYTRRAPWTVLVDSEGGAGAYASESHVLWAWFDGPGGHMVDGAAATSHDDLDVEGLSGRIRERVDFVRSLDSGAPTASPTEARVLLPPEGGAQLARSLGTFFTGQNIESGLKPLLDRVGTKLASDAVTLVDDPRRRGGLNSRPWDDEGTPAATTTLIENGVFQAFLHTRRTAAAFGGVPGAAARAEAWDRPVAAPTNVYLAPGPHSRSDLLRNLRDGFEGTGLVQRGRIDSGTGKFTTALYGWWVRNGERVRPAAGVNVSSDVFRLLRRIRAAASDDRTSYLADGASSASILVDRMEVS